MAGVNVEIGMTGASSFVTDVNKSGDALAYLQDVAKGAAANLDTFDEVLKRIERDHQWSAKIEELSGATAELATGMAEQAEGAAKLVGAFFDAAESTAAYGDEIDKQSQKLGISRRAYQEWNYILNQSGTSVTAMKSAMQQLAKVQEGLPKTAVADLEAIGLSLESIQDMSREDVFAAVIAGLQGMEEGSERATLAQRLLGSSYKELQPLLNSTATDTDALRERFYALGGYMSDEAVDAAVAYGDSVDDINLKWEAFQRDVFAKFLPALTELRNGVIDNGSLDRLADKAASLAESGVGLLSYLVEHGDGIITIVEGIGAAWATWKAAEIVGTLVTNVQQLYSWLGLVGEVLGIGAGAAAGGIAVAGLGVYSAANYAATLSNEGYLGKGKELEEYAANVAYYEEQVAKWHQQNDEYIQSGYTEGLEMLQQELSVLEAGLQHAQEEYNAAAASAQGWGEDMMAEFANGIDAGTSAYVIPAVDAVTDYIAGSLHHSEPDFGPLSDDNDWMPDMMRTFAQGITDNAPLLRQAVTDAFALRPSVEAGFSAAAPSISYGGVSVVFQVQPGQDGRALFEEFSYWLENEMAGERAVFAQ